MWDVRTIHDLSGRLSRIQTWLADHDPLSPEAVRDVAGLVLRIDPANVSPYPSSNPNRAVTTPGGEGWTSSSAAHCRERYQSAGVHRFFVWVSACDAADRIESDVLAAGLMPFTATTYPVLVRRAEAITVPTLPVALRRFEPEIDGAALVAHADEAARRRLLATAPQGVEHFVAWDGEVSVGTASLAVSGGVGYLFGAGTLESHRGRGIQSALIALRVNRAVELGCEWLMSETVGFLRTSLGNLERNGFEVAFEKRVFQPPMDEVSSA